MKKNKFGINVLCDDTLTLSKIGICKICKVKGNLDKGLCEGCFNDIYNKGDEK